MAFARMSNIEQYYIQNRSRKSQVFKLIQFVQIKHTSSRRNNQGFILNLDKINTIYIRIF